jgi:hypothetical protein
MNIYERGGAEVVKKAVLLHCSLRGVWARPNQEEEEEEVWVGGRRAEAVAM